MTRRADTLPPLECEIDDGAGDLVGALAALLVEVFVDAEEDT